jgi:hypothetical protein
MSSSHEMGSRREIGSWRELSPTTKRILCSPLVASSLLFGVPVVLGIVVSIVRLLGVRYPDLGWATTVNSDAEELYLGHTLYQNPAHGYTGQIYTPLFPAVVSLFDRLYLWNGWSLLVVIGATVSLVILAARIAYTRAGSAPRVVRILGAAGIGGVAYWCVAAVGLPLLDEARADQLAWAFALFGLIAVADFGPAPSRRRVVVAALLLSLGMWTKQTTVAIAGLAFAWVLGLAALSLLHRKAALLFAAVLLAGNLSLLLVLNILTHGWEFFINFEMATRQANEWSYAGNVMKGLRSAAPAIAFVALAWFAGVAGLLARRRRRRRRPGGSERAPTQALEALRRMLTAEDPTARRILLLGLYVVSGFVIAAYFMRKQGTETNQMIGVVWALGLFAAAGWHVAQSHVSTAAVAGVCMTLFFVLVQLGPIGELAAEAEVTIPAFEQAAQWPSVPSELLLWARHHTLYTQLFADLNVPQGGPLYPNYYNFADLLAAGTQPLYLVHALLNRRFEGVSFIGLEDDPYTSANGRWEENYLWKLDEVIAARYMPEPGLPKGVLGRRPGPEQAGWMRHCFGPFIAGGASFRIHHGGGFWCSFAPNRLKLVRTPAALSEVVTTEPVRVAGAIAVTLEARATNQLDLVVEGGAGAEWLTRVQAVHGKSDELTVSTYLDGRLLGSARVPATVLRGGLRRLNLDLTSDGRSGPPSLAGVGAATIASPPIKAPFELVATDGAEIDLGATRLTG